MPLNPIFRNKKFKGKSFNDMVKIVGKNWPSGGFECICCSKPRPDNIRGNGIYTCSDTCAVMWRLTRYGNCDHCHLIPNFAYEAEINCDVCGRRTIGTSD